MSVKLSAIEIRRITAEETLHLRHKILRPHQTLKDCQYVGDHLSSTLHLGAYRANELVGIATLLNQNAEENVQFGVWRLRGMAVLENCRNKGVGGALLRALIAHFREQGGSRFWCNARTSAVNFYSKFEMSPEGEEFDISPIGPHFVFSLKSSFEG